MYIVFVFFSIVKVQTYTQTGQMKLCISSFDPVIFYPPDENLLFIVQILTS